MLPAHRRYNQLCLAVSRALLVFLLPCVVGSDPLLLQQELGGFLVAILVLSPEAMTAVRAALCCCEILKSSLQLWC